MKICSISFATWLSLAICLVSVLSTTEYLGDKACHDAQKQSGIGMFIMLTVMIFMANVNLLCNAESIHLLFSSYLPPFCVLFSCILINEEQKSCGELTFDNLFAINNDLYNGDNDYHYNYMNENGDKNYYKVPMRILQLIFLALLTFSPCWFHICSHHQHDYRHQRNHNYQSI